ANDQLRPNFFSQQYGSRRALLHADKVRWRLAGNTRYKPANLPGSFPANTAHSEKNSQATDCTGTGNVDFFFAFFVWAFRVCLWYCLKLMNRIAKKNGVP